MGRDAPPLTPDCPFCGAREAELVSQFGGQLMTSQWQCRACGSYFEAVREDFAAAHPADRPVARTDRT
jgi:transcription elongation factor Elf1